MNLSIIVSNYYKGYKGMLDAALDEAKAQNVNVSIVSEVPGCYDMPVVVQELLKRDDVDAVLCLSVILPVPFLTTKSNSGDDVTSWDETLANGTIDRLDDLSVKYSKPVVKELIGPGFPIKLVQEKVPLYARAGVNCAKSMIEEIERIRAL